MTVCALNLFDVANRAEYLADSKRSVIEVARYGGTVVALGKFRENGTSGYVWQLFDRLDDLRPVLRLDA